MCIALNVATKPPSPHIYGQPSQSVLKQEEKTITLSSNKFGFNTFWSLVIRQYTHKDNIIQWIYHEEHEPSPPLKDYFQEAYPYTSKLSKNNNYQ